MDLEAFVPKDQTDLLPGFRANRKADVRRLRAALAAEDWAQLQHIAERLYAVGNPYGFRQITTFGRLMRVACAEQDRAAFRQLIEQYALYLANVVVVEVDTPVIRRALSDASREMLLAPSNREAQNARRGPRGARGFERPAKASARRPAG
jgi:hypothetical protein